MENPRRGRGALIVALVVVVALLSSSVTALLCTVLPGDALRPLAQMADTIERAYYYYDQNVGSEDALIDAALRGMVASIGDDYAQYYTAEQYASYTESISGEYSGIGVVVAAPDGEGSAIQRVYDGSPMALAGAQAGDLILSVNGTAVANLSLEDMLALFHTDGSADTLALRRDGADFTVTVTAAVVNVPYTSYELLSDGVGYLRIFGFNGHVVQETGDALAALVSAGATSLVLDLRDNPGGGLNEVLDVADLFLKKGDLIVSIKSRTEQTAAYYAEDDEAYALPLVVLVNGNSASASELLSGALQDHGVATILGTQTFGKGIVQSYFRLAANGGYVKLTTDAYFTPNDVCIHGVGITPDLVVELPEAYRDLALDSLPREQDTQLAAAIAYLTEGA